MNRAIISLGSNVTDKESVLRRAVALLDSKIIESTQPYIDPVDNQPSAPYLNIVTAIETEKDHDTLRAFFKELERKAGRTESDKSLGLVPLDIDIVVFNGKIMRPADFDREYFKHGYRLLSITRP